MQATADGLTHAFGLGAGSLLARHALDAIARHDSDATGCFLLLLGTECCCGVSGYFGCIRFRAGAMRGLHDCWTGVRKRGEKAMVRSRYLGNALSGMENLTGPQRG